MDGWPTMAGRARRSLRWAIGLAALLAGAASGARAEAPMHTVAPAPAWVRPLGPEAPPGPPPAEADNGVRYLLLDRQIRVGGEDRASYQHLASQVLNEHGLENAANLEIRFDPSYQKLTLHEINIRRGGRLISKLPTAKVRVLQRESGLESLIFDGSRTAHVFLEDVRVGDIVEYAYTVRGSNPVFGNRHFGGFDLQYSVPVSRLHLRLLWPAGRPIHWTAHNGAEVPTARDQADEREFAWDLRGVPARLVDADAPSWFDPYPSVEWSEFPDWAAVAAWATPLYTLPAAPGPRLRAVVAQIAAAHADGPGRLLAALRYVQGQVRYLGIEVGPGSHAPNPPELVLERRYGDCKDKTLLTVALLRGLGIEAWPALVHTGTRHEVASRQPSPGAFNHVVVKARLDGRDFWLDPTRPAQHGDAEQLVQADFGRALLVAGDARGLVPMAGEAARAWQREIHAVIDSRDGLDKPARYTVTTTAQGAAADSLRGTLEARSREELQKQYLNYYTGHFGEMEVAEPMLVTDEHEANRITVKETYLLKALWQPSAKKHRREATIATPDLSDYLQQPRTLVRNAPLSLAHPARLRQVTEVLLPEDWTIRPKTVRVEDPAFEHERQTQWNDQTRTLTLIDAYASRTDHVEAADVARYAAHLDQARENISYVLYKSDDGPAAATGQSVHWLPAVTVTLGLLGFAWLGLRLVRWDPAPPAPAPRDAGPPPPRGIGGWLLLPAIALPVTVWRVGRDLVSLVPSWSATAWHAATDPAGSAYHPLYGPWLVFELLGNLGLLALAVVCTVLFFRRRSSLPRLYCALLIGSAALQGLDNAWALQIPAAADSVTSAQWGALARSVLSAAIWVAYFQRSARVRATFVERRRRPAPPTPGEAIGSGQPAAVTLP